MKGSFIAIITILIFLGSCKPQQESKKSIGDVIKQFEMSELMEGVFISIDYRSSDTLRVEQLDAKYSEDHVYVSSIYYLITPEAKDSFHTLKSDEIWHWYEGDPIKLTIIEESGEVTEVTLGKGKFQHTVRAGSWYFSTQMGDNYSLVGLVVVPGFEDSDFTPADRDELVALFPEHRDLIVANTEK